jgi:hypothetical protein
MTPTISHEDKRRILIDAGFIKETDRKVPRGINYDFILWAYNQETSECINWPFLISDGKKPLYPSLGYKVDGESRVNRLICKWYNGSPKESHIACHKCGNTLCINKHHIYWGDYNTNVLDSKEHGTFVSGCDQHNASLNEQTLERLWWLYDCGDSINLIASDLGVDVRVVKAVIRGERYQ